MLWRLRQLRLLRLLRRLLLRPLRLLRLPRLLPLLAHFPSPWYMAGWFFTDHLAGLPLRHAAARPTSTVESEVRRRRTARLHVHMLTPCCCVLQI